MRLAAYLKQEGLTQGAFARRLGLRLSTFNAYVTGQRRPPVETVAAITEATGGAVQAIDLVPPDGRRPALQPDTPPMTREAFLAKIAEVQAHVRRYVPAGVSLVDELIRERREEAAKE